MSEFKIAMCCLSVVVSMALVLVIFGQRQVVATVMQQQILREKNLQLYIQTIEDSTVSYHQLEMQLTKSLNEINEPKDQLKKLVSAGAMKNTQFENCQAEKKKKAEELLTIEKEQKDHEAAFKTETESWTAEVTNLKQQMEKTSQVCAFVKQDSAAAKKLCPSEEPTATAAAQ